MIFFNILDFKIYNHFVKVSNSPLKVGRSKSNIATIVGSPAQHTALYASMYQLHMS